ALDVPEGDVDRRDRAHADRAGRKEAAARHRLPEELDPVGVGADQELPQVLDRADERLLLPGQPTLADAGDALVGVDDDEAVVSVLAPDDERLDVGDLHEGPPRAV